jgi:elongation factor P
MLYLTDLKPGASFIYNNDPHEVVSSEHSKQGRGGAIMRTRIQNLITGALFDRTFKGNESFEEAEIEKKKAQFLYKEGTNYCFMDPNSYEQFSLSEDQIGNKKNFLKEGAEIEILYFQNKPINISLPIKMDFKVTYTEPGFKGNTQSATTKPATLETDHKVQVPLFVKIGDIIKIDTRTGQYLERV